MILDIFDDMWTKLNEISDSCYNFVMSHYDEPFLWLIIFVILLVVGYKAITAMANK